jgi:hypothetical protein
MGAGERRKSLFLYIYTLIFVLKFHENYIKMSNFIFIMFMGCVVCIETEKKKTTYRLTHTHIKPHTTKKSETYI